MPEGSHRVAVIDVGTNSARLLVADVADGRVSPVERRSTVTRLGRGVDLSGRLSAEAIEDACEAIGEYVGVYQELGAESVEAIATSAVRDAENGSAFVAELRERFALSARVLDGEEEARLTYLGATSETAADRADPGGRHRRRLDRADRRHRRRDLLPHLAPGRRRPPQRAPRRLRPADRGRAGSPGRRRARPDRGRGRERRRGQGGDRRRRHPDLAGRDRDGARALRPGAGPRPRPLAALDPADALPARLRPARASGSRSPACTPTGRRRSSPGS